MKNEESMRLFIRTPKAYISTLPRYQFGGRIIVVQGLKETERAVRALSNERMVGFDTETRPQFRRGPMRPPALVQLSTSECCFLFRIHQSGILPPLAQFLSNPDVLKVGISLGDDRAALNRSGDINPQGWVDLQDVAKRLQTEDRGLARLFANVFGLRISKSQQRTNWETDVLTQAQKVYAATDAEACLRLYHALSPLLNGKPYELKEYENDNNTGNDGKA